jgi:iron uptake system component EfeO
MPSPWSLPRLLLVAPLLLTGAALAGCGGSGSGTEVEVSASDDACEVSETELDAGDTTFAVTNDGDKVTEVYVYGEKDGAFTKVVSEVENIGPGTSRDMDVDLAAGSYEIACKPGQKGDGIRQQVTVTGEGGGESEDEAAYDREIELTVADAGLTGLDPATADTGEKIEFKLQNDTDGTRTLEVVAPDGDVAAEFDVPVSEEGEAVVELAEDGDWTVKVEGGSSDVEQTLTVG